MLIYFHYEEYQNIQIILS